MSSSESTGVYVHESRFPIRILRRLVQAAPRRTTPSPSHASYVQRLTALFVYEAHYKPESNIVNRQIDTASSSTPANTAKAPFKPLSGSNATKAETGSSYYGGSTEEIDVSDKEILTFESPIEGLLSSWNVSDGDILVDPEQAILRIIEPCKHPVQLGGLCAICGKDLTGVDYSGFSETSRANIQITHDSSQLMVSMEEAARMEQQTAARLEREKRLSLIVDLDQTVIHATVEETVGDWMNDEHNPNFAMLKDVQRFRLLNDRGIEIDPYYYIKPRPGAADFLLACSEKYECHVYTMATRAYAEHVCQIIDPEGKIFSTRILSRDESGSMFMKSLERLFPVDQSKVVVIDDRADVWNWSPNLIKVVPFEFFPGAGDINGAFLPKRSTTLESKAVSDATKPANIVTSDAISLVLSDAQEKALLDAQIGEQKEAIDHQLHDKPLARMQEQKTVEKVERDKEKSAIRTATSSAVPSASNSPSPPDTPLLAATVSDTASAAARTPSLSHGIGASRFTSKATVPEDDTDSDDSSGSDSHQDQIERSTAPQNMKHTVNVEGDDTQVDNSDVAVPSLNGDGVPHVDTIDGIEEDASGHDSAEDGDNEDFEEALLTDNDRELDRVLAVLNEVHRRYYNQFAVSGGVPSIIPDIKAEVLRGCHIVFSSVFPLDQRPERSEVWQAATQFGAICSNVLHERTTHVVAAKAGTSKVHAASRRKGVHIVRPSWLSESVAIWKRASESDHLLDLQHRAGESSSNIASPAPVAATSTESLDAAEANDELEELLDESLQEVNWGDAAAEVDALLDETDSEDGQDELASDSESLSGRIARKRGRSGSGTPVNGDVPTIIESPLSKRRKVAAARAGKSKLKMSDSIDSVPDDAATSIGPSRLQSASAAATMMNRKAGSNLASTSSGSQSSSPTLPPSRHEDTDDNDDDDDDDDLDDFAKALEGELS